MRYFTPPTRAVLDALQTVPGLGAITTPAQGNRIPDGVAWCADNGYGPRRDGTPGRGLLEPEWFRWLSSRPWDPALCAFAVAPDVVADADATRERSRPWLPRIRGLGYPAAYVAQDGETPSSLPWDETDVVFIGGSTEWKLGPDAARIAVAATARGIPVHVGRVNSVRRFTYAWTIGASSVDGTLLTYGPDRWLPLVRHMIEETLGGCLV